MTIFIHLIGLPLETRFYLHFCNYENVFDEKLYLYEKKKY